MSWADLGRPRPSLDFTDKKGFSAWRSGIYSSSKYVWGQKIGSQWWFTQENDYHAFYAGLYTYIYMYIYISNYIIINMDTVKYRRARGFTHLDDMGMHGLYRYTLFGRWRCHPSKMFNTWAKTASFGK